MIRLEQVSKWYVGGDPILKQVDLQMEKGEMMFLTGPSGAGKSTLLRLIALLDQPSSGQITVNDRRLSQLRRRAMSTYRSSIGLSFQSPSLLRDRTVFENVSIPLEIQGLPQKAMTKRVHEALDWVGLLKKENQVPSQLSGGEQQRVGLARAVVHQPMLLLADEPTGHLDAVRAADTMALFQHLHQQGMSVLVATHDLRLIAGMKHRILLLKEGRLC